MNKYVENLNRIEFVITYACTGCCKHCSEGDHAGSGIHIDADTAEKAVREVAGTYQIDSVMTFGGEPLLYPETVYAVHLAAKEMNIPKRQLITNGFFSKDSAKIKTVANKLVESGVNDICLSVDAFHQETIPLETVKEFAIELKKTGVHLRVHPAWLVSKEHDNPYNKRTREIIAEFEGLGILSSDGNVIIPRGNAIKYLSDYYDMSKEYENPYDENPEDIRAICFSPDGAVLDGNIYQTGILEILERYEPKWEMD